MINGKMIKVCGMRQAANIRDIEKLGKVDMIGFIFYPPSPRFVCEMPAYLPINAHRVGVFVNEDKETVKTYADRFGLNYVQLHGNESPEYCQSLHGAGLKIIKTFSIACPEDLNHVSDYEETCELFLFDTKCKEYGGSGSPFDWNLLHSYKGPIPFLLSGGIHSDSAGELQKFSHPRLAGYDLNSRFETQPALKDPEQIQHFFNELESSNQIVKQS